MDKKYAYKGKIRPFDFKKSPESVFMSNIDTWRKENLLENMAAKRTEPFKNAV